jgi:O-antigen/teichoic acid export membrane protein
MWITHRKFSWIRIHAGPMERKTTKSLFSYSAYLFITDIGDRLRFGVDPVVITAFVSLAAVTHYRIASVFTDQYMRVVISVVGVFWPLLSQLHAASADAKIKKTFFFATKISVCVASFLCFGLIAWGKPMIQRWMGLRYMDSYGPLVVLTLAVLLDLLQLPSVSLLFATFKHRVYAFSNLTEGILNLGVSLILVRQYGILGVALGTLVAAIVIRIIVQPWWMCRVSQISYSVYARFLAGNVGRCAGLIGASYLLISWGLRPNYVYLFGSAACASVLYAAGSWLVVFDKNERDLFRAALRKQVNKQDLTRVVAPSVAI